MRYATLIAALGLTSIFSLAGCQPTTYADGISPGKRQLAASLGLDPRHYSLNELARIKHRRETDPGD
jgi:hypothetical protein